MIIDHTRDYKLISRHGLVLVSGPWCYLPSTKLPGHLVITLRSTSTVLHKECHNRVVRAFSRYPWVSEIILPYSGAAIPRFIPLKFNSSGACVSCQDIKTDHTLVYWCDVDNWDCWQSFRSGEY